MIPVNALALFDDACHDARISNWTPLFSDLFHEYRSPMRRYHGWEHIREVLSRAIDLCQLYDVPQSSELILAIFYHDVVYLPGYSQNELESADHACHLLRANGAGDEFCERIKDGILATIPTIGSTSGDKMEEVLVDADLAWLGGNPNQYSLNAWNIRGEFAMFSDELWTRGRKAFLKGMLDRPAIYHLSTDLEEPARRNMEEELISLG